MSVQVVEPNVILIARPQTFEGTRLSGIAAKCCTSAESFGEILDTNDTYEGVLKNVLAYGHLSVTEFDFWVFGIENVSRTLTHQLVRKRLANYAQESMRYTSQGGDYKVIVPKSLEGKAYPVDYVGEDGRTKGNLSLTDLAEIVHIWYEEAQKDGVPNEDARFGLLEASKTKILVGMNTHGLLDFFGERTCRCAQWEIRGVATTMLRLALEADPVGMAGAGPKCHKSQFCVESKKKWETCRYSTHISEVAHLIKRNGSIV
jgi:thymidylate synthase (FAD)